MNDCNDKKDTILGVLFASREENICVITKEDKKKIKDLIKDNDKYEKVLEFLDDITNDNLAKDKLKNSLESYIDGMNIVSAYENEKFYEIRIYGWCKINIRMCWKGMLKPRVLQFFVVTNLIINVINDFSRSRFIKLFFRIC